jgi:hypothetical protein
MGLRSEYRRKHDGQTHFTDDVQAEIDRERQRQLAPEPTQEPLPEPRPTEIGLMAHNGNGHVVPPWADELESGRALHYSASVQAPPSRDDYTIAYAPPRQDPKRVRLSAEQLDICKRSGIVPITYARNMLQMEEMKRRGDLQT